MFGQVDKTKFEGAAGAYMACGVQNQEQFFKKPEENPLSNANLPGGIFTHPNAC